MTSGHQLVSKKLIRSKPSPDRKKKAIKIFSGLLLGFITSWWCAGWQAVDRSKAARQPWLAAPGHPADTIQRWVAGTSAVAAAVAAAARKPAGRSRKKEETESQRHRGENQQRFSS